jgi:hemerythrin-like domain-containing protein
MRAVVTLLDDHHYIGGMLDVLEASVRRLQRGGDLDGGMAAGIRQYFETFVATHERKEIEVLFPHFERHLPRDDRRLLAPLGCEHQVLDDLRAALFPHVTGTPSAELGVLVRAYAARKREHMHLEDTLLQNGMHVPDEELEEALARIDRAGLGPTGREWFIQVALDYTDIVSTWSPDLHTADFERRSAALRRRAQERESGSG